MFNNNFKCNVTLQLSELNTHVPKFILVGSTSGSNVSESHSSSSSHSDNDELSSLSFVISLALSVGFSGDDGVVSSGMSKLGWSSIQATSCSVLPLTPVV